MRKRKQEGLQIQLNTERSFSPDMITSLGSKVAPGACIPTMNYVHVGLRAPALSSAFDVASLIAYRDIRLTLRSNLPYREEELADYLDQVFRYYAEFRSMEKILGAYTTFQTYNPSFSEYVTRITSNYTEHGNVKTKVLACVENYAQALLDYNKCYNLAQMFYIPKTYMDYIDTFLCRYFNDNDTRNTQYYTVALVEYHSKTGARIDLTNRTFSDLYKDMLALARSFGLENADITKVGKFTRFNRSPVMQYGREAFKSKYDVNFFNWLNNAWTSNRDSTLLSLANPLYSNNTSLVSTKDGTLRVDVLNSGDDTDYIAHAVASESNPYYDKGMLSSLEYSMLYPISCATFLPVFSNVRYSKTFNKNGKLTSDATTYTYLSALDSDEKYILYQYDSSINQEFNINTAGMDGYTLTPNDRVTSDISAYYHRNRQAAIAGDNNSFGVSIAASLAGAQIHYDLYKIGGSMGLGGWEVRCDNTSNYEFLGEGGGLGMTGYVFRFNTVTVEPTAKEVSVAVTAYPAVSTNEGQEDFFTTIFSGINIGNITIPLPKHASDVDDVTHGAVTYTNSLVWRWNLVVNGAVSTSGRTWDQVDVFFWNYGYGSDFNPTLSNISLTLQDGSASASSIQASVDWDMLQCCFMKDAHIPAIASCAVGIKDTNLTNGVYRYIFTSPQLLMAANNPALLSISDLDGVMYAINYELISGETYMSDIQKAKKQSFSDNNRKFKRNSNKEKKDSEN